MLEAQLKTTIRLFLWQLCCAEGAVSLLAWGNAPGTREVRTTSDESAIHEELSYSPAQFRKVDQPAPSPQSSPRKRGEAQYFMQSSILSRGAGVDFDERYAWD